MPAWGDWEGSEGFYGVVGGGEGGAWDVEFSGDGMTDVFGGNRGFIGVSFTFLIGILWWFLTG